MIDLLSKVKIHQELLSVLLQKEKNLENELIDLRSELSADTKSSAGDKHETSRAMNQLEQERISEQLLELKKALNIVKGIDTAKNHTRIGLGSLMQTTKGFFYLSIGHGAIKVGNQKCFCLSPVSPFGKLLIGKVSNDNIIWQGEEITIMAIQ